MLLLFFSYTNSAKLREEMKSLKQTMSKLQKRVEEGK